MSAFAGLARLDGKALDGAAWSGMKAAAWGPMREWTSGNLALAGTQVHADGRIAVAADARIDNRDALREALHVGDPTANDAALIAFAYARWGADCVGRLLGDFAFLLWDAERRVILGARDPLGVRPFFYCSADGLFAAATSLRALLPALPSTALDEGYVADFVAGAMTTRDGTAWRDARRLPPGHVLTLSGTDLRLRRYWALDAKHEDAPADAAERFRALLQDAIECRIPKNGQAGFMVSGGLDSSSIAVIAARMPGIARPLPALSMTLDTHPDWSDGRYLNEVLASDAFAATCIPLEGFDPLADLDAILDEQQQPFLGYNHASSRQLYGAARALGLNALFDGHAGDEVVSQGMGRINELARAGEWREAWRQAQGIAAIHELPAWQVMSPYLDHLRPVRAVRQRWRRWMTAKPHADGATVLVAPDLAARVGLVERPMGNSIARHARHTERDLHVEQLEHPIQAHAFEVLANGTGAAGIAPLYPFADRRLVEFCVGLPAHEKLDRGLPRYVMRQAMKGYLPESVRLRPDKFNFLPAFTTSLLPHVARIEQVLKVDLGGIGRYVDREVALRSVDALKSQGVRTRSDHVMAAWRIAVLGRWLERIAP